MELAPISESVLINDGGLATELEARGHDLSDPLWSARLLADDPHEIVAVHAAYFRAGATIAAAHAFRTARRAVGGRRGAHRRRLLPGAPGRHCGAAPSVHWRRKISEKLAVSSRSANVAKRSARKASGTPARCR
ncbi:homocysteine S-methyltransferase [Mycobacterium parascrofulaceum ATCC BAA-614]|uniref:Homocysteine S-methyltransferase n=1 Tax=Mycobacterium parascrofulaceum ATCC BAA-614 TaxID=525368 RepID=D5PH58_9MYCO|nr:homocysteine S-methyltransferase [Mycobacterium parascrofulaceum ATCC BAA-614]